MGASQIGRCRAVPFLMCAHMCRQSSLKVCLVGQVQLCVLAAMRGCAWMQGIVALQAGYGIGLSGYPCCEEGRPVVWVICECACWFGSTCFLGLDIVGAPCASSFAGACLMVWCVRMSPTCAPFMRPAAKPAQTCFCVVHATHTYVDRARLTWQLGNPLGRRLLGFLLLAGQLACSTQLGGCACVPS